MNSVWVKPHVFRQQRIRSSLCSCPPLLLERETVHSGEKLFINELYKLVLRLVKQRPMMSGNLVLHVYANVYVLCTCMNVCASVYCSLFVRGEKYVEEVNY